MEDAVEDNDYAKAFEVSREFMYTLSAIQLGTVVDDYAATAATTGVVNVGGSITGDIETTVARQSCA